MARGWESKSVEAQQEASGAAAVHVSAPDLSPAKQETARKLGCLELSRKRVLHDLEHTVNPRYRLMLEAGLKHLDDEIAKLH